MHKYCKQTYSEAADEAISLFCSNGHFPHSEHSTLADFANTLLFQLTLICPRLLLDQLVVQKDFHTCNYSPIMVTQTPNFIFNFLFVVAMSFLEGGLTFPHILPPTLFTRNKINDKTTITV